MRKYKTIEVNEYEDMLKEIGNSDELDFDNFDLLIYGGGGQDKKFYSELKTNPKYEVLWSGWSGQNGQNFFPLFLDSLDLLKY